VGSPSASSVAWNSLPKLLVFVMKPPAAGFGTSCAALGAARVTVSSGAASAPAGGAAG